MIVSFLIDYANWKGMNLFDLNNASLPDDCLEHGLNKSVQKALFDTGYFVSFYTVNDEALCTVCCINHKGNIEIKDHKISYNGNIYIQSDKRWKTLYQFNLELQGYRDHYHQHINDEKFQSELEKFTSEYNIYYENEYLVKLFEKLGLPYIDLSEYSLDNVVLVEEMKREFLEEMGYYFHIGERPFLVVNEQQMLFQQIEQILEENGILLDSISNTYKLRIVK